ncbi:hypothetical protein [Nocardiopsis sp. NPDC055824]
MSIAATATLLGLVSAAPAQAEVSTAEVSAAADRCTSTIVRAGDLDWLQNPYCVDPPTIRTGPTLRVPNTSRIIEVRYGHYRDVQYGWARLTGSYADSDRIILQVDTNGDGLTDRSSRERVASERLWTSGTPTRNNVNWQFRACVVITATTCTAWD